MTSWYRERKKKNFLKKNWQEACQNLQIQKIKSVLFVPRTERGELFNRLWEEKSGTQLCRILCKRNPWVGQDCGDSEAGGGDCRRRNITYIRKGGGEGEGEGDGETEA